MRETEIGTTLVEYFTGPGHEIFCEVQCNGIIDMVIRCGNTITAIECKTTFGLAVIEQAVNNRMNAHYSYVAVPKVGHRSHFAERICKEYGIGILRVTPNDRFRRVEELLKPKLNRNIIKPKLAEFQSLNTAGSQHERWTSFSWFVDNLQTQLRRSPSGLTHKELFDTCHRHYNNAGYLKRNVLTYIRQGVIKDVEFRDKRFHYNPTPAGRPGERA